MLSAPQTFTLTGLSPASDTSTESSSVLRSPDSPNGARRSLAAGLSERACQKCRASKRRCDKFLPQCTRCSRLGATCVYLVDTITGPSTTTNQEPLASLQSQSLSKFEFLCAPDPLAELTVPLILSLVSADAAPGEQMDWTDGVRAYYACVHKWYSVVHRGLFDSRIDNLCASSSSAESPAASRSSSSSSVPRGNNNSFSLQKGSTDWRLASAHMSRELALLVLAMYLSARTCSTRDGRHRAMFDNLYRVARRALALGFCESALPRIEFVQIGALLALYEYGHGDSARAYKTLSETVAAARVLGIRPGCAEDGVPANINGLGAMEQVQKSGLWWSSFILDQIIHRDEASAHLPFILETPGPTTLLPEPGQDSVNRLLQSRPPHHESSSWAAAAAAAAAPPPPPPNQRLPVGVVATVVEMEPFQISAKVASLLHRALRHNHETRMRFPSGTLPPVEIFAPLDQEIRNMTLTLLEDAIDWRYALDCFAMCVSALFTLYLPFLPILETRTAAQIHENSELRTALAALRFAAQLSSDITCKMNSEVGGGLWADRKLSCRELAALAAPTCYLVVQVYTGLRTICPDEYQKCQDAILDKYKSLQSFKCRWGIADKMMSQLDEAYGVDWYRHDRSKLVAQQTTMNHGLTTPPPQVTGATMNSEGTLMDLT